MQDSDIPDKFQVPFGSGASGGNIRAVPYTTVDPNAASELLGFPPSTLTPIGAGGVPPDGRDFNGILNQITAWCRWFSAGGPIAYDATFQTDWGGYPNGAVIASAEAGNFWRSTTDNNVTDPDTGGAGWVRLTAALPQYSIVDVVGISSSFTTLASWTVGQIVAATAGGVPYYGTSLSLSFDGSTTGANGMDTGTLPASNPISVYAIYNPTTDAWRTLGTSACFGRTYTGAHLPAGYTASALLWSGTTTGLNKIAPFNQADRQVSITNAVALSNGAAATPTSFAVTIIPPNAKTVQGEVIIDSNSGANSYAVGGNVGLTIGIVTAIAFGGTTTTTPFNLLVLTANTLWYRASLSGLTNSQIYVSGYTL